MIIQRLFSLKEKFNEFKKDPKEGIRKTLYKGVDTVVDNPLDTGVYVAGDLVLPGMIYKKLKPKMKTKKSKILLGATMGAWASSPVGPTSAAIALKNKRKKKKTENSKSK